MDKSILMQLKNTKQWYIDFDYTLFNTGRFRDELYAILYKNGYDENALKVSDESVKTPDIVNIRKLFKKLASDSGVSEDNFLRPLEQLYARGADFVYDDVAEFLRYLKENGVKVICLTFGDNEFQREKVEASGLEFDEIIPTGSQMKFTLDGINYPGAVFVDDSVRDLTGLANAGATKLVRMRRPGTKNFNKTTDINVLEVASLKDLMQLMQEK